MVDYSYEMEKRDEVIDCIKFSIEVELEGVVQSISSRWRLNIERYSISRDTIIKMLKKAVKDLK